jgi:predicted RNA-binding protein (virulence factor B family)
MKLGEYNDLTIERFTGVGAFLSDDQENEVLLPKKYLLPSMSEGDLVCVFLYKDSEDRPVATTEDPKIVLNSFAYLRVKEVNLFGAFMDWGLEKDLMVPFKEQGLKMQEDFTYLVTLRYDNSTDRLFATSKVNKYLLPCEDKSLLGQPCRIMICDKTDLGLKVIVNDLYHGMIFNSDINQPLKRGAHYTGFIQNIREDGKIDIRMVKTGIERFDESEEKVLKILEQNGGFIELGDKSDPDEVRKVMGMSKKMFKQAIGKLYKAKRVLIQDNSLSLIPEDTSNEG